MCVHRRMLLIVLKVLLDVIEIAFESIGKKLSSVDLRGCGDDLRGRLAVEQIVCDPQSFELSLRADDQRPLARLGEFLPPLVPQTLGRR